MPTKLAKSVPVERKFFAKNLKEARLAKGLTLQELEALTGGISHAYISTVERCLHNISLDYMTTLSHALKVPLYALLNPQLDSVWSLTEDESWTAYEHHVQRVKPASLERHLLGQRIKQFRAAAQFSQSQFDQLAGFHTNTTSLLEREAYNITLDKLPPLTAILRIPLSDIFLPEL